MRYKFAEIAVDAQGHYHLKWFGAHPDQGGMTQRWGSVEFETLEDICHGIAMMSTHNQHDERMRMVHEKESKKESDDQGQV